eukprot:365365-Chlamydomonas_euryale.AAC.15
MPEQRMTPACMWYNSGSGRMVSFSATCRTAPQCACERPGEDGRRGRRRTWQMQRALIRFAKVEPGLHRC